MLVSSDDNLLVDIFRYNKDEIHFNLMAVVSDLKTTYETKMGTINEQLMVINVLV